MHFLRSPADPNAPTPTARLSPPRPTQQPPPTNYAPCSPAPSPARPQNKPRVEIDRRRGSDQHTRPLSAPSYPPHPPPNPPPIPDGPPRPRLDAPAETTSRARRRRHQPLPPAPQIRTAAA